MNGKINGNMNGNMIMKVGFSAISGLIGVLAFVFWFLYTDLRAEVSKNSDQITEIRVLLAGNGVLPRQSMNELLRSMNERLIEIQKPKLGIN